MATVHFGERQAPNGTMLPVIVVVCSCGRKLTVTMEPGQNQMQLRMRAVKSGWVPGIDTLPREKQGQFLQEKAMRLEHEAMCFVCQGRQPLEGRAEVTKPTSPVQIEEEKKGFFKKLFT